MKRDQAEVLADAVRRAREARGLSIRKAADAGGLSDTTWRRLEDVERLGLYTPRNDTLKGVATALRVKVDQVRHWAGDTYDGMDEPLALGDALAELGDRGETAAARTGAWADLTELELHRVLGYTDAIREQRGQPPAER